jgi:hypothetical protein
VLATLLGMESRRYSTDLSDAEWTLLAEPFTSEYASCTQFREQGTSA